MYLHWIQSGSGDSDWFVVAKTSRLAKSFYANEEGRGFKEVLVRRLAKVDIPDSEPTWPSDTVLKAAGVEVTELGQGKRLVIYNGETLKDNRGEVV